MKKIFLFCSFHLILFNLYGQEIKILNRYVSLYKSDTIKLYLNYNLPVRWTTDNSYFHINNGIVNINSIPPQSKKIAKIYVQSEYSKDSCEITSVDWISNKSSLTIKDILANSTIIGKLNDDILFSTNNKKLFKTKDFTDISFISNLPNNASDCPMVISPNGFLYRNYNNFYFSKDLKNWQKVFSSKYPGLYHEIDY